jgi:ribosomal protein L14E/L6E/L27E
MTFKDGRAVPRAEVAPKPSTAAEVLNQIELDQINVEAEDAAEKQFLENSTSFRDFKVRRNWKPQ